MKISKQLGLLVVIGVFAVAGYYGWQTMGSANSDDSATRDRGKERAVTVETAPAQFLNLDIVVEAVGTTRALRTVEITPLASGRVTEVLVTAGKSVKEGEVLLRLDDDIQRADLVEAEARLKDAEASLKRSETLRRQNAIATATVENLTALVAVAKATRDRAARRLRDRVVRAPFAGVVGFSNVELGARVEEGDVVTVLDDLSVIEVEFSLPEALYGRIKLGKRIVADAAAFPEREFNGAVDSIDSRIDQVSRSFKARAVIANEDRALPAGMFVHLSVVLDAELVLAVPEESVVVEGSHAYVYAVVERDGVKRVERRYIRIGRRSFGFVEIAEGISDGEHVIIKGLQKVRDGSLIKITASAPSKEPAPAGAGT